jgi:hypothetical protein
MSEQTCTTQGHLWVHGLCLFCKETRPPREAAASLYAACGCERCRCDHELITRLTAALLEAEQERDERGRWSAHWHGEYVLAEAQLTRVREAAKKLRAEINEYTLSAVADGAGHTNAAVLQERAFELDAALAEPAAGAPELP